MLLLPLSSLCSLLLSRFQSRDLSAPASDEWVSRCQFGVADLWLNLREALYGNAARAVYV